MKSQHSFAAVAAISVLLSACSLNPFAAKENTDYRTSARGPALDVPPDLTAPRFDDRFRPPGSVGVAGGAAGATGAVVLPKLESARVERLGNERWLVVNQPADQVWPTLRAFWQEAGFKLVVDRPEIGVLETDWLESRVTLSSDPIRNVLGRILQGIQGSSGLRDKYRLRLERAANNSTEIYLTHRGLEEIAVGAVRQGSAESFAWSPRAVDTNLEAEMLNRMMVRLGLPSAQANQVAANVKAGATPAAPAQAALPVRARVSGATMEVDDPFDRAWRRVGLALDRVGFTVVDRDRTQGTYFVRYADEGGSAASNASFTERLKFWKSDDPVAAEQYRVTLKETSGKTNVVVLDKNGAATAKSLSDRILGLLVNQLK